MPLPSEIDAATVHEAQGRRGALPSTITPVGDHVRVYGPAFTVDCPPGDNLWIHRAVYAADPGDVLVIDTRGAHEFGYWGEILSEAALARGLGGLVINGGVRDVERLAVVGFPVFAANVCMQGTVKDSRAGGRLGVELTLGSAVVCPKDIVLGDADGVVVVSARAWASTMRAACERIEKERGVIARLRAGETTLEMYGLPEG